MNSLHDLPISSHGHIFGSVSPSIEIDPSKIFTKLRFSTPIFTPRLLSAQSRLDANDTLREAEGLYIVGAWRRLGGHEDAWITGLRAAQQLGAILPFEIDDTGRPVKLSLANRLAASGLEITNFIGIILNVVVASIFMAALSIWTAVTEIGQKPSRHGMTASSTRRRRGQSSIHTLDCVLAGKEWHNFESEDKVDASRAGTPSTAAHSDEE